MNSTHVFVVRRTITWGSGNTTCGEALLFALCAPVVSPCSSAITGEERIREHTDQLYGALLRYESKPAAYQEARIGTLRRELDDAQKEFDQLATTEVRAIDKALQDRKLPPIPTSAAASVEGQSGHGGA
jgi:hypothetical protein